MKYIDRLLQGAPVEWRTLGEVGELKRGRVISKVFLEENKGTYPVYSSQTANNGEIGFISTFDFDQEAITWTTDGANAGTVFYRNGRFSITNVCGIITIEDTSILNYRFLFHWLSVVAKGYVYSGMGNPKLMSNQATKIEIPIPPVAVQEEVVRVLDKFTALEAELEVALSTELDCRKRQYGYYRDTLLTFDLSPSDGLCHSPLFPAPFAVEWCPLGEVAEIGTGRSNRQDEAENGEYPFYVRSKDVLRSSTYQFDETAIVIPGEGGVGDIYHYVEGKYALHQRAYRVKLVDTAILSKFIYHFMGAHFKEYITVRSVGATATSIRKPMLENFLIPIPPLSVQERIVEILDKFDTLVNSISEGLPREIELRRKQYEYYRDALLSF